MPEQQGTARRGRPPATEQDRSAQRLAISRVAVGLFAERGVGHTSGADIAAAAGISERTLWRLFRTKEACVEPLLTASLDGFRDVLRSWPEGAELTVHLRDAYTFVPGERSTDTDAVLSVVRMTHDTPALRAVWLVLQERAEATLAEVLAPRLGRAAGDPEVRLLAASVNAAFRVVTDEVAATGLPLPEHRERLADAVRQASSSSCG